ncbi:MAG: hypothetical protein HUJ95_00265, partial [Bacteroidales bacterium]|nr:hypothetical protein [Bacteroidales bacterium]
MRKILLSLLLAFSAFTVHAREGYFVDEKTSQECKAIVDSMTLDEKIGQLFAVQCTEKILSDLELHPSGLLMFAFHFKGLNAGQIRDRIKTYKDKCKFPLIVMVDEEGGRVSRIGSNPNIRSSRFETPKHYFNKGGIDLVLKAERQKVQMLDTLGINLNLAPVADITTNPEYFMYSRSLGMSAEKSGEIIGAIIA